MAVARDGEWGLPLASGEDYELCLCLPARFRARLLEIAARGGCSLTPIGRILPTPGLICRAPMEPG